MAAEQGEYRKKGRKRRVGDESDEGSSSSRSSSEGDDRRRKRRKKRHQHRRRSPSRSSASSEESDEKSSGEDGHSHKRLKKYVERKQRRKEKKRKQKKEEKKRKKEEEKERLKRGPVTASWGKYGLIKEVDMWNKRPEFSAWLAEVKKVNLETLPNWEERQMFKEYMEDFNTATLPSKKYYDADKYHRRKLFKKYEKGSKVRAEAERTVFNDEEQRRQELKMQREHDKQAHIEELKHSMSSGMAQAMREQAQLREEMQYQFRLGNLEAANAIQRRLEPDAL